MNLHKNKEEFYNVILETSKKFGIIPAIIEKDYYVTLFLNELNKRVKHLLFKGGTSLSKCYKIINRFSEDIDLTLNINNQTQSKRIKLKKAIIEVCDELGLKLINKEETKSRRDYNKYEILYPILFEGLGLKQFLLVETVFMVKAYPEDSKLATCLIYDYLYSINDIEQINKYKLYPFNIQVQTLERTFIDKIFAICDYALANNTTGYSRHIYDLYMIIDKITINQELKMLFNEVRNDRKNNSRCFSSSDECDIPNVIKRIIEEKIYYKDYENITKRVLYEKLEYNTVIQVLTKILDSDLLN